MVEKDRLRPRPTGERMKINIVGAILLVFLSAGSHAASPRSPSDLQKDRDLLLTGGDAEQQVAMSNLAKGGKLPSPCL